MKLKKLFALALCFAVVGSCLAFAAPAHAADVDGLVTSKVVTDNGDNTATIRLESYVTGRIEVDSEEISVPNDIVLVLDTSGSMTTALEVALSNADENITAYKYRVDAWTWTGYEERAVRYENGKWQYQNGDNWADVPLAGSCI